MLEQPGEMQDAEEEEEEPDPIHDIVDHVSRAAGAFPSPRPDAPSPRSERAAIALHLYTRDPRSFLLRFGPHLAAPHLQYFERLPADLELRQTLDHLKRYHSPEGRRARVKNRRFRALEKLRDESDYFSEREMMYRNPLLYERLVGRYLTDEEVAARDETDSERLTLVGMILDTVDRNQMRQTKNEQLLTEKMETTSLAETNTSMNAEPWNKDDKKAGSTTAKPRGNYTALWGEFDNTQMNSKQVENKQSPESRWGEFKKPDVTPSFEPEVRKKRAICAPERDLLRREFLHEMYTSFLEGDDVDFDYSSVDDNDMYDDLQILDRDKEEEYFDSEPQESENLEESMVLVQEYGRKGSVSSGDDDLDVFMEHLNKRNSVIT